MGIINNLLPKRIKPISRYFGFCVKSLFYKLNSINKKVNSSPIFVLGNQKSGTSVIASLLGELTDKKIAIDLFYSGFRSKLFEKWKDAEISTSDFINLNKIEFSSEIIKEPHLTVFYKELKSEFQESKFVFIVRNPLDNIRSILDRLNVNGNKKNLSKSEKKSFFHSWNLLLNNHWIGGNKSQYIEVLAERWNIISNVYLQNKDDIILIKYEDFLSNKQKTLDDLAKILELEIVTDITHNLDRQYQPKGNSEIDLKEFFGEENYKIIERLCKENMKELGY
jgi:hypothetical protein